jgi:hypothetical protein
MDVINLIILDIDYRLCITPLTLGGYKVEEKLHLGIRQQKGLNATGYI